MNSIEDIRTAGMKFIVALFWVNAVLIAMRTVAVAHPQMIILIAGGVLAAAAGTLTWKMDKEGMAARITAGLVQATQVALLVGAFSGSNLQIDMHMYFFAALAICAACIDWRPIVAFTGLTAAHHSVLYFLIPAAVFPGESSIMRVALHAVILVAEATVLVALTSMMWKLFASNQTAVSEAEQAKEEAENQSKAAKLAINENEETQKAINAEKEHANDELQRVIRELATGLSKLAQGDVTHRIRADFDGQFAGLKDDFNTSVRRLESALSTVISTAKGLHGDTGSMQTSSNELAQRAEQQAEALRETGSSVDRITQTVEQSTSRVSEAGEKVTDTKEKTAQSAKIVTNAVQAMDEIKQSSEQVGQIINVIDEIAFQTNLLALNAGVEAARAGEAGKGFAVVAQEVRELAQRSATAAKEIKELIDKSSTQVENGVELVNQTGDTLKVIEEEVYSINELISGIASAFHEQADGLKEINHSVSDMDRVTSQNAQLANQSTQSVQGVTEGINKLVDELSVFTVHEGYQSSSLQAEGKLAKAS